MNGGLNNSRNDYCSSGNIIKFLLLLLLLFTVTNIHIIVLFHEIDMNYLIHRFFEF